VVIALGSNQGDSLRILDRAGEFLLAHAKPGTFRASRLHRSKPVDCPPGSPDFFNAVVLFEPITKWLDPFRVLSDLQQFEKALGRREKVVLNEPRPLDLDIIAFRGIQICSTRLVIPHPRATKRSFVLKPLAEIAPHFVFPGTLPPVSSLATLSD
jgi:2-amino-4-hydroxy-6-hydroxymethyldihydropteridine diphosphokinase